MDATAQKTTPCWTFLPLWKGRRGGARGRVIGWTCVDSSDVEQFCGYKWCLKGTKGAYVVRHVPVQGSHSSRAIYLHREILGLPQRNALRGSNPRLGDHENGDRLDNRRCNLRVVGHAGNARNKTRRTKRKSDLPPRVYGPNRSGKYDARVTLGSFETVEEAVAAVEKFKGMWEYEQR